MTTPISMDQLLELAKQAGDAIMEVYNSDDFGIEQKADDSPLTKADLASHQIIVEALERLTPEIPVLSEESAKIPFETRREWQRYWLIDPLDGTREFVKRNGEFTVNIALVENQQATLGVIYAPVLERFYYGVLGEGAWKKQGPAEAEAIQVQAKLRSPAIVAGSRSHAGNSLIKFLENIGPHELTSMGSSLKFCLVADGSADLYPRLGLTSEWDTAAAQAVVEAAGGKITMLDMQPLRYNTKDSLLNPFFFVFGDSSVNWSQYLEREKE
ncbi:3'(2'),5'-bisphosphate nucleotidase CysQ [endosymbiont of Ridgeia piscesae]|jgi:3'(2'), 5'-bisphosphate nucleotidase|uniref:3'(2'),5'-bisphosphate nucleotidase CysQ n=1 Tax=endosymbiont of Ridgeia piscesae TaxID=54398 RepID=A0A0T5ZBV3_9GAMM|nr:3'(2'),5'-bisphosphate nucleotidase CysQ [endosymbiont of Ridgeia piscesae]KRT53797.1 3'(2'),5'-bisphosphate nucleotidase [endosymbiont of Ridgeia piscesae]KRT60006.1 3'(2'),5'-bisphosphate nucleotidase [endosymbiont of Ridgeia piscesae]